MNKDPRIEKIENLLDKLGNIAVEAFHYIALFIIGCMIAWSAVHTIIEILTVKQYASIDDILLLFIYLELGAMVKLKRIIFLLNWIVQLASLDCYVGISPKPILY